MQLIALQESKFMDKKRKNIIFSIAFFIIVMLAGVAIGYCLDLNSSSANVSQDTSENEILPYSLYESMYTDYDEKALQEINNNPIDEKYLTAYKAAKEPAKEIDVLNEWAQAYEVEFDAAYAYLVELINENEEADENDFIDALEKYKKNADEQSQILADLTFTSSEFILGHGSGHSYDAVLTFLNSNRENTLRLVECVYSLNGSYDWFFTQE